MHFTPTKLVGAFVIEPEAREDERGLFARTYCQDEFAVRGLNTTWVQCNVSYNRLRGTLRGLHWQAEPHAEVKLVRCTAGAAFDVIVDLRPDSPTYRQWVAVELTADNRKAVYIPAGFAHGFQSLSDGTELFYQMSEFYHPELAFGARWDDPALGIKWPPTERRIISDRDLSFPDLPR
jgi:dTDP-4-dehydrorhamnose 3,5-epimerase